ncbi:MAG: hypothetical protein BWY75_03805 [bacterium ADurb.Bin425]|nr:MAG: hypothetical protein BWY75_03805 [bacterium ADurb.Bin425]
MKIGLTVQQGTDLRRESLEIFLVNPETFHALVRQMSLLTGRSGAHIARRQHLKVCRFHRKGAVQPTGDNFDETIETFF